MTLKPLPYSILLAYRLLATPLTPYSFTMIQKVVSYARGTTINLLRSILGLFT